MPGAITKAEELAASDPRYFIPQQFENPANPEIHRRTTAEEIWRDTDGQVDILVAGVGTGGTITGVGEVLKARKPVVPVRRRRAGRLAGALRRPARARTRSRASAPASSPRCLNTKIYDEIVRVEERGRVRDGPPLGRARRACWSASPRARRSGRLSRWRRREESAGKLIVVIIPSFGERYLSTPLFADLAD